jgi:alkylation response protein AidB-like acyl-CoA dehydrogenase
MRLAPLLFAGNMPAELRDRLLPQFLADDRCHLAHADREPESATELGIDYHRPLARAAGPKTTAVQTSDGGWAINGQKTCVANATVARLFAVPVMTAAGATTLIVPHNAPGLSVRNHDAPGRWYHGSCGELTFKDCRVPAGNMIGPLANGAPLSLALSLGIGRAAYEAALDYAHLRVQGGRPIVEHQAIGAKLANIAVKLAAARSFVWQAAWASDHPDAVADRSLPDLPLATAAQVFATEAVLEIAKDSAEVFGAMGVMRDMPLHRFIHDARVCLHSGDGNDDARLRIAEALVGYRSPYLLAAE